jgi:hypothetical protein
VGTIDPIAALRIVRELLLQRDDQASRMVATAIHGMLIEGLSFEIGMGLMPGWRGTAQRCARDHALAEIAAAFFPRSCVRQLAREVATALLRYGATAWPRDKAARRRPDGLRGLLFDVLMAGPPPGFSQLRNIFKSLAGQPGTVAIGQTAPEIPIRRKESCRWP